MRQCPHPPISAIPDDRPEQPLVLIPARNEERTIRGVVEAVREVTGWPIVVIDDASSDNTSHAARDGGAIVLTLPISLGAWGAIQTGIRYTRRLGYRYTVTMDADGQHLAHCLPDLFHSLEARQADVVIGACPSRMSRPRRFAWRLLRLITGLDIEDLTSGLRVYNHKALSLLDSPCATILEFQDVGVLMLLRSARLRIVEVGVPMAQRSFGRSRVFSSLSRVLYYIAYNLVLCLGKRRL